MRRLMLLVGLAILLPAAASGQSAGEVERCFQNPLACSGGGGAAPPLAGGGGSGGSAPVATARPAPPDYTTVLQSPEPERKRIQEALRTLDKYNGPIDGNLQSEASVKAIGEWQKGRGTPMVGKLTPTEAQQLIAEASRAPIRRIEPSTQVTAPAAPPSNADALKALRDRLAERRKAAEPKADAAVRALIRDLKAYVTADGKGIAGEQFATFAKWYADNKAAGRSVGNIAPAIDDYGEASMGAAATAEVRFDTKQGAETYRQCLVFAWIEGTPRKDAQAFSCDDIAAVEKWKTDHALKSAWR